MNDEWKPWALQTEGPPCARLRCKFWVPMFKYQQVGNLGDTISDGVRLCQSKDMHPDFSCFTVRPR